MYRSNWAHIEGCELTGLYMVWMVVHHLLCGKDAMYVDSSKYHAAAKQLSPTYHWVEKLWRWRLKSTQQKTSHDHCILWIIDAPQLCTKVMLSVVQEIVGKGGSMATPLASSTTWAINVCTPYLLFKLKHGFCASQDTYSVDIVCSSCAFLHSHEPSSI